MNTCPDTHPIDTPPIGTHPIVCAAFALLKRAAKAARTLVDTLTAAPRPPASNPEAVEEQEERAYIARRAFYAAGWLADILYALRGKLAITYNPRPKPGQIRPKIIARLDLPTTRNRHRDRFLKPIRPLKRGQIDPYTRRMLTTQPLGDVIAKICRYIGLPPTDPAYPHKLAAIPLTTIEAAAILANPGADEATTTAQIYESSNQARPFLKERTKELLPILDTS